MYLRNKLIYIIFFIIISCQPTKKTDTFIFDYSKFDDFSISAKSVTLNNLYEQSFSKSNIENQIKVSPNERLESWLKNKFQIFGNENKFIINILDSSISRDEIENEDAKNYEEKTIYVYKVSYLVEFELYDNSNYLLSNISVENSRSTTSNKYISLNELESIVDLLIFNAIQDLSSETKYLLNKYMSEYLSN